MELVHIPKEPIAVADMLPEIVDEIQVISSPHAFIEANTVPSDLREIKEHHIIPVWVKDNEPVISHAEFIETALSAVNGIYHDESILEPNIRLSHPIKGRIPEAKHKAAKELLDSEKTIYFERMAFIIEVPSLHAQIGGNRLNLTIGGVKAYNLDNLNNKSGADQHFKVFVGFKNTVCTNLCVSTDGLMANLKVKNISQLKHAIHGLLSDFNAIQYSQQLEELEHFRITEQQFANLIGRCRMFKYLNEKESAPFTTPLHFGDAQINNVCKDYYNDNSFCRDSDGSINLWKLYNLFTGANKSSYIDSYLDRSANAFSLSQELLNTLKHKSDCWYLN